MLLRRIGEFSVNLLDLWLEETVLTHQEEIFAGTNFFELVFALRKSLPHNNFPLYIIQEHT